MPQQQLHAPQCPGRATAARASVSWASASWAARASVSWAARASVSWASCAHTPSSTMLPPAAPAWARTLARCLCATSLTVAACHNSPHVTGAHGQPVCTAPMQMRRTRPRQPHPQGALPLNHSSSSARVLGRATAYLGEHRERGRTQPHLLCATIAHLAQACLLRPSSQAPPTSPCCCCCCCSGGGGGGGGCGFQRFSRACSAPV